MPILIRGSSSTIRTATLGLIGAPIKGETPLWNKCSNNLLIAFIRLRAPTGRTFSSRPLSPSAQDPSPASSTLSRITRGADSRLKTRLPAPLAKAGAG